MKWKEYLGALDPLYQSAVLFLQPNVKTNNKTNVEINSSKKPLNDDI